MKEGGQAWLHNLNQTVYRFYSLPSPLCLVRALGPGLITAIPCGKLRWDVSTGTLTEPLVLGTGLRVPAGECDSHGEDVQQAELELESL